MEIPAQLASLWDRGYRTPWITMGTAATVFGLLLFGIGGNAPGGCAPPLAQSGQIVTISADSHTVALALAPAGPVKSFSSSNLGSALASLGSGDSICFSASGDPQQTQQLDAITVELITVGWLRAVGALLLAFAAVWWVMLAITNGHPWGFALGLDGRLSNSQTQIYLWFLVLTTGVLVGAGSSATLCQCTGWHHGADKSDGTRRHQCLHLRHRTAQYDGQDWRRGARAVVGKQVTGDRAAATP